MSATSARPASAGAAAGWWTARPSVAAKDGPAMSDKVYALALARIEAVMGCTKDSPEEAELVLWPRSPTRTNERPGPSPELGRLRATSGV